MAGSNELLSVGAAADLLGVHVVTIRRWTDEGKLPEVRTPGGHRRIPREAVDRLLRESVEAPVALPAAGGLSDQAWAEHALVHTRYELRAQPETPWNAGLSEEQRAESRENGQRLMGLLLRHVAGTGEDDGLWDEVRHLARRYAEQLRWRGLPPSEALRATMFFRDALTESTAYYPHLHEQPAEAQVALLRKVNAFMNEVQLAIAKAYEADDA